MTRTNLYFAHVNKEYQYEYKCSQNDKRFIESCRSYNYHTLALSHGASCKTASVP